MTQSFVLVVIEMKMDFEDEGGSCCTLCCVYYCTALLCKDFKD